MTYARAGEFSQNAVIQYFTTSADVARGAVVTITPAATSTVAPCADEDAPGNGPYAVAIQAAASGEVCACVIYGEVGVIASGNCYKGALVYGKDGAAVARTPTPFDPELAAPTLGMVTEGAADGGVCTVFVGLGGV